MPFERKKLPDAPIFVITRLPSDDFIDDLAASLPDLVGDLDAQSEPVFVIVDLTQLSMDLDIHLRASSLTGRGENPMLRHPMLRETVFVSHDALMNMVTKGIDSPTFGFAKAHHFETLDEALDYCYQQLGQTRGAAE